MKLNALRAGWEVKLNKNAGAAYKKEILSNLYSDYKLPSMNSSQISFQRKWKEHTSWGATVNPDTKEVNFKLFTFPDAKKVTVTIEQKDSNVVNSFELENKRGGIFETSNPIPSKYASDGDSYYYTIEKADGTSVSVKDPYSFKQDQLLDKSVIYDQSKYNWSDEDWFSTDNSQKIARKDGSKNNFKTLNEARIFELNVATFSKTGDFKGVIDKLDEIKENGFNTIEIMPVENTYSFNWGYDGVDKFAVSKFLGGPDELKKLIDTAHQKGLNVIIDMVPNHHGPDGSQLGKTGPYLKGPNDFGDAYNFEGENSTYVRDFMVNAALNWLNNYHVDGIRFDMTKYMESDITMKQIAAEVNYHFPLAFLIAEDSRDKVNSSGDRYWYDEYLGHDLRVVNPLKHEEFGRGKSEAIHSSAIEEIVNNNTNLARLGYDSEWDFNYFHVLKDNLYGNIDIDKFIDVCVQGENRVKYVMSHDEIGNFEGTRLISKLLVPMLHLNENIVLNKDDLIRARELAKLKNYNLEEAQQNVIFQKAQLASEKLANLFIEGVIEKYFNRDQETLYREILEPLGISKDANINSIRLKNAFNRAFSTFKMANAITYLQKGPKMVFQGDENASLTPFRFFRQFQSIEDEDYLFTEKGYKEGKSAYQESMIDDNKYNSVYNKGFLRLIKDLNDLNEQNSAIANGKLIKEDIIKHHGSHVVSMHFEDKNEKNNIYAIINFSDLKYPREDADLYYIKFPKGKWVEILNTDDKKYKGTGRVNTVIESDGAKERPISLSNKSVSVFRKIS